MARRFLSGKWIQIIIHILLWTILIIVPLYLANRYGSDRRFFRFFFYKDLLIYGILFYINYLIFVPQLFFKGKRLIYFLTVVVFVACFYFISYLPHEYLSRRPDSEQVIEPPGNGQNVPGPDFKLVHAYNYTITSVVIIFLSLGLGSLNRQAQIERRQKELEKDRLDSELAFLKNQISPHLFFNTLNNIYSLIEINTENAKEAVLKLSRLMRYLLYESEQSETQLSNEIEFMNHYIDLMKLRLTDKVNLNVTFPGTHERLTVPPLLFIPFIENAFKHGIGSREKSEIDISLKVHQNILTFQCKNSIAGMNNGYEDLSDSGIGLENAIKRLNLLFPDNHELKISKTDDFFDVFLEIRFKKIA